MQYVMSAVLALVLSGSALADWNNGPLPDSVRGTGYITIVDNSIPQYGHFDNGCFVSECNKVYSSKEVLKYRLAVRRDDLETVDKKHEWKNGPLPKELIGYVLAVVKTDIGNKTIVGRAEKGLFYLHGETGHICYLHDAVKMYRLLLPVDNFKAFESPITVPEDKCNDCERIKALQNRIDNLERALDKQGLR